MDPYNDLGRYGANRVVGKEPCPYCRAGGADTRGDNLIRYLDGHAHCFACGRHEHSQVTMDTLRQLVEREKQSDDIDDSLNFPQDFIPLNNALYGKEGSRWIGSYCITCAEIERFSIGWSQNRRMLIFPVYDKEGTLIFWQGRNFEAGPKYLTFGEKSDILHLVGNPKSGTLVVTEDMVSAIKVGRTYQAASLWGAEMSLQLIQKAASHFDDLVIWLDNDKLRQAVRIALRASQYIPTSVVDSALDPKDYTTETICQFVCRAQVSKLYKDGVVEGKTEAEEKEDDPRRLWIEDSYPPLVDVNGMPLRHQYKEASGS